MYFACVFILLIVLVIISIFGVVFGFLRIIEYFENEENCNEDVLVESSGSDQG